MRTSIPILERIQQHTEDVESGDIQCPLDRCPGCRKKPVAFKRHERRRSRGFLVPIARLVRKVPSLVVRWKCPLCGTTFTAQPPFALPRRRYTRETIFEKSLPYVVEPRVTYRELPLERGLPVFYDSETEGKIDDRELSYTTVHRWITSLSLYTPIVRRALRLIRGRSSKSTIFRKLEPILPRKYRSPQRRRTLQRFQRLFEVEAVYRTLFHTSIFPRLAAQQGWACAKISSSTGYEAVQNDSG